MEPRAFRRDQQSRIVVGLRQENRYDNAQPNGREATPYIDKPDAVPKKEEPRGKNLHARRI